MKGSDESRTAAAGGREERMQLHNHSNEGRRRSLAKPTRSALSSLTTSAQRRDRHLDFGRTSSPWLRASVVSLFLSLMSMSATAAWADTAQERQFAWQAANWTLSSAQSEAEFLKAADQYRELAREGVRNGPLFYNLGTALLNAERYDEALHYLARAERYMGTTWEIERNMLVGIAKRDGTTTPSLPAHRILFFWHYRLASSTGATIAVIAFAFIWIGLMLRLFGIRRMKYVIAFSLLVFVLFGTSVAASVYQESRADLISYRASDPTP